MASTTTPLDVFAALGSFHVILLHFPIGFLAAAACLELWSVLRPQAGLRLATTILLVLGATTAVASAACGWLLAETGGYDDVLLERHRWLGVATAVLAVVVLWLRRRESLLAYRVALAACIAVTAGAGHIGGMLTHGSTTPFAMLASALRGCAALVADLQQRGMLDDTLVIWGGEFGRTPMAQLDGRDHHIRGFSMWLAGAGVRGGMTWGATDELGYFAVENPVHVHDLHATMLRLLGIDHKQLTFRYRGRDFRLTDEFGQVVHGILT